MRLHFVPRVAVLLSAYNGVPWLHAQLDSILAQQGVDVTVYISVDKSTDGTFDWVRGRAESDSRVLPLAYGERFGDAAKNFFRLLRDVDFTSFDCIAFADQDDIWYPDKLKRACYCITAEICDGYSSSVTAFWPDGRQALVEKSQSQRKWDYYFEAAGPGCTYVMSTALGVAIKNCVVNNSQRIGGVALHDWFCYAFARAQGYRWYIDPVPSMLYRQHERNQFGVNAGFTAIRARVMMVFNGWWLDQVRLIAQIVQAQDLKFLPLLDSSYRAALFGLSLQAWRCRRRVRDRLVFIVICWGLIFKGPTNEG